MIAQTQLAESDADCRLRPLYLKGGVPRKRKFRKRGAAETMTAISKPWVACPSARCSLPHAKSLAAKHGVNGVENIHTVDIRHPATSKIGSARY
jgi:hypothetical protein